MARQSEFSGSEWRCRSIRIRNRENVEAERTVEVKRKRDRGPCGSKTLRVAFWDFNLRRSCGRMAVRQEQKLVPSPHGGGPKVSAFLLRTRSKSGRPAELSAPLGAKSRRRCSWGIGRDVDSRHLLGRRSSDRVGRDQREGVARTPCRGADRRRDIGAYDRRQA